MAAGGLQEFSHKAIGSTSREARTVESEPLEDPKKARKRHRNERLRKHCDCPRRKWPKCPHAWHMNYTPRGGRGYRFSLDVEVGEHIESLTEAKIAANKIKTEIDAGTFVRKSERLNAVPAPPTTSEATTLEVFGKKYAELATPKKARDREAWQQEMLGKVRKVSAFVLSDGTRFGEKPIGAVTEDDFERFLTDLRAKGRSASNRNQYVQLFTAMSRWAAKKGYVAKAAIGPDTDLRREKPARRNRRLEPGEEQRLLAVAPARLQRLIIAALETCCRRGVLLKLQWKDVNFGRREITIRAENAKDDETRILPISSRLYAVLEMSRTDPAGKELGPDKFVFGDVTGDEMTTIKRAWETAVLKAHAHGPKWAKGGALSPESRSRLREIDLHFHDLRHEAACGLAEGRWPLHHVQQMLGHADLSTTSIYVHATKLGLQDSMRKLDEMRTGCNPVAIERETDHRLHGNGETESAGKSLIN